MGRLRQRRGHQSQLKTKSTSAQGQNSRRVLWDNLAVPQFQRSDQNTRLGRMPPCEVFPQHPTNRALAVFFDHVLL